MHPGHLAYYITAHGYGHGVRSCDILRAVHEARPDLRLTLCTDLPHDFLTSRLPGVPFVQRPVVFDSGMVQVDSVRVDVPASLQRIQSILATADERVADEARWLEEAGVTGVVCDIPSLPMEAAARVGIPKLGISNFTWSWIYGEFLEADPAWEPVIERFQRGYAAADLALRLPFAEAMDVFPRIESVGVVSRPGNSCREEIAVKTGAALDSTWVLLSFSTLEWSPEVVDRVSKLSGKYTFFTLLPLQWEAPGFHALDRRDFRVPDIFAAMDAVLSKPGFGVLSECLANRKPLIYVEREHFREYPVLEAAIHRLLRHVHLPARDLYEGRLLDALRALPGLPEPPEQMDLGGDRVCAERILQFSLPKS